MRRSKLTPTAAAAILEAIRNGNTIRDAATLAGIHHSTLYEWDNRGQTERDTPINPDNYTKKQLLTIAEHQLVDWDALGIRNPTRCNKTTLARHIYQPTPYTEFSDAYARARAEAIATAIAEMRRAGKDDWRMWHAYLAALDPDRWARRAGDDAAPAQNVPTMAEILDEASIVLRAIDGTAVRVIDQ